MDVDLPVTDSNDLFGVTLTSPLILSRNPVVDNEVATKQYVDNKTISVNSVRLGSGTLRKERFPAFTGDAISFINAGVLQLTHTVQQGIYCKVLVSSSGRVIEGFNLSHEDIPPLSWNNVIQSPDVSSLDYGILDGLKITGDAAEGFISSLATPSESSHAVTKNYADITLNNNTGNNNNVLTEYPLGTVIYSVNGDVYNANKYTACDGRKLLRSSNSEIYSLIGDRFIKTYNLTHGNPERQQYDINFEPQSGDTLTWTEGVNLPIVVKYGFILVIRNYIYYIGGFNYLTFQPNGNIYRASLGVNGEIGAWGLYDFLPFTLHFPNIVTINDRLYVIGGYKNYSYTNKIYTASISLEGNIGSWTEYSILLPTIVGESYVTIVNDRLYIIGGWVDGNYYGKVYSSHIKPNGELSNFVENKPLPYGIYETAIAVTKNKIYILGGQQNFDPSDKILCADVSPSGDLSDWYESGTLPFQVTNHDVVVTRNRIYVIGGDINYYDNSVLDTNFRVMSAPINSDGTFGTWSIISTLPHYYSFIKAVIVKNRLYIISGISDYNYPITLRYTTFSGGENDYMSDVVKNRLDYFYLPNLSNKDDLTYYLKYL